MNMLYRLAVIAETELKSGRKQGSGVRTHWIQRR